MWRGTARGLLGDTAVDQTMVLRGVASYDSMAHAMAELRALDDESAAGLLARDVRDLNVAGRATVKALVGTSDAQARDAQRAVLEPLLGRLERDANMEIIHHDRQARQTTTWARLGVVTAILLGMLMIATLAWRFERLRRRAGHDADLRAIAKRGEQRLRALVDRSRDVVAVVDEDLRVRWSAASIHGLIGIDPEEMLGRQVAQALHAEEEVRLERFLERVTGHPGGMVLTVRLRHAEGGWRTVEIIAQSHLDDPAVAGVVLNLRDVTEREALETELRRHAFHDGLTGLANRALFEDRLTPRAQRGAEARQALRDPLPRPRRLQDDQRRTGPRARRPGPLRRRRAHRRRPAQRRHGGPLRR